MAVSIVIAKHTIDFRPRMITEPEILQHLVANGPTSVPPPPGNATSIAAPTAVLIRLIAACMASPSTAIRRVGLSPLIATANQASKREQGSAPCSSKTGGQESQGVGPVRAQIKRGDDCPPTEPLTLEKAWWSPMRLFEQSQLKSAGMAITGINTPMHHPDC